VSKIFKKCERHEFENLGQRLLHELPESIGELARRSGLPKASLSSYRSGSRKPSADAVQRMQTTLGIPAQAWGEADRAHGQEGERPRAGVPDVQAAAAAPAPADDPYKGAEQPRRPLLATDRGGHQSKTVQEIDALLARANATMGNAALSPGERSKAATEARSLLRLRAGVIRQAFMDQDVKDDEFTRTNPTFRELMTFIARTLAELNPEVLRQLLDATREHCPQRTVDLLPLFT
jgi:transcriptional regulator with XRE-family HTH domain